jgi:hypothetical protein
MEDPLETWPIHRASNPKTNQVELFSASKAWRTALHQEPPPTMKAKRNSSAVESINKSIQ